MTRHGMLKLQAAGAQSPVTDLHAHMVIINTERAGSGCTPSPQSRAQTSQSAPLASIAALPGHGHAIADISRKSKSP
ncbi:hypothetical protein [Chelativorans sp. M5D2P16]|uniref:hypothetical protein n=1 Tax=Chelativorans sp. M5D2P16 TaxID=3095678 RepID=UPI002ACA92E5|nr:hypothetical protein [Chelativorans sp. M5D2P16]MDZ5696712.1 hypothetical protein [Chelativorans sp. M5D2P16]